MKRISIDLEKLPFLIVSAAFLVLAAWHVSEVRENARLYPVIERAQQLTRDCLTEQQDRVDTLQTEVNRTLFLSRPPPSGRLADQ